MTGIYFKKSIVCLLLSCYVLPTLAGELAARQYAVTEAQKQYDLEKTRHDDATRLVNEQQQRVAQDQALLKERQQQQAAAKARMQKAKAKLDAENSKLKQVWKNGSH